MAGIRIRGEIIIDNRCPRCTRQFRNAAAVRNHMNQPYGACKTRYQLLLRSSTVHRIRNPSPPPPEGRGDVPIPFHLDTDQDPMGITEDPMDITEDPPLDHTVEGRSAPPEPICEDQAISSPFFKEEFVGAARTYGRGGNLMDKFHADQLSSCRAQHPYYPFADRSEWETASWLLNSGLSMKKQDEFLHLERVQQMKLSFRTAKDLRHRCEILPSTPKWKRRTWSTEYPTKSPVVLLYRDPIECLQSLLENPLAAGSVQFTPFRLFRDAEKLTRVYTEWLSGDAAWSAQAKIPVGATVIGTILSSDKTNISAMTGNRVSHPLQISCANLTMDYRSKPSNHAFKILALIPVAKFLHPVQRIRGMLESRLFHDVIDFVCRPLKIAATIGVMLNDPSGYRRYCFTPIASYIADTPEASLVACVGNFTSPITMASCEQFGDPFRHEARNSLTTLNQLRMIKAEVDPSDLRKYLASAKKYRLNGVHLPFWRDWPMSNPVCFITTEILHWWHKFFFDHDLKWCINVVGASALDFRFSVLQPHTGFRHFVEGVSKLKQVTGREHREMERYIIPVIAGAVHKDFLTAIRSLLDFRYLGQSTVIDDNLCRKMTDALSDFHTHKQAIIDAGGRRGKKKSVITTWRIPKLEFMQSVVPNLRQSGVPIQWSADRTENMHCTDIKTPAKMTNNRDYGAQICRHLDRREKCRLFDLTTAINSTTLASQSARNGHNDGFDNISIDPVTRLVGAQNNQVDYFTKSQTLPQNAPRGPPRIFTTPYAAFHLNRHPSRSQATVETIAQLYDLPDLPAALADYIARSQKKESLFGLGNRRITNVLPTFVSHIEVWDSITIQSKAYHHPHPTLPPMTINAKHKTKDWPIGQCDSVMVNQDPEKHWPQSGIDGHVIAQVRLAFRIVPNAFERRGPPDQYLTYVQRFDIVPQINEQFSNSATARGRYPEPSSSLYVLKRGRRADNTLIGDVIPVTQIRSMVDLVPRYGVAADRKYKSSNVMAFSSEFWLNKYFTKELCYALSL